MAYCINCGTRIEENMLFCPECGTPVLTEKYNRDVSFDDGEILQKKCPNCGDLMPEDMFYCLNCGYQFKEKMFKERSEDFGNIVHHVQTLEGIWKNKWVSLLLCVFFGWLGIHRFYEGKPITGLIYLFTLGIFGIGWIVDIIRLVFKPNPYRVK